MRLCPLPDWYLYTTDTSSLRLLTYEGEPWPELTEEPASTLAELAPAFHAKAHHLERELQHPQVIVAMQRWRRYPLYAHP